MGVEHLQLDAAEVDRDPQGSPRLELRQKLQPRQRSGLDETQWVARQDRVAIGFLRDLEGRVKLQIHLEVEGDLVGLVDEPGSSPHDVELLQRHDVGLALGEHVGNALRRQAPIGPDAAMDVVRYDPRHSPGLRWREG